jgi:hypothetical protein
VLCCRERLWAGSVPKTTFDVANAHWRGADDERIMHTRQSILTHSGTQRVCESQSLWEPGGEEAKMNEGRRQVRRLLVLTATVAVLLPTNVECQNRKGFWIGFGPAYGWTFSDPYQGHNHKWGGMFIRAGGTINPRLRLGGELIGVSESVHEQRFNTTLMVQYFPVGALGLYGKAGAGLAEVDVLVEEADGSRALTHERAVGLTLGAGWEIPVFGIAVNAATDALYQTVGGIEDASGNSSVHWVLLASIGIMIP